MSEKWGGRRGSATLGMVVGAAVGAAVSVRRRSGGAAARRRGDGLLRGRRLGHGARATCRSASPPRPAASAPASRTTPASASARTAPFLIGRLQDGGMELRVAMASCIVTAGVLVRRAAVARARDARPHAHLSCNGDCPRDMSPTLQKLPTMSRGQAPMTIRDAHRCRMRIVLAAAFVLALTVDPRPEPRAAAGGRPAARADRGVGVQANGDARVSRRAGALDQAGRREGEARRPGGVDRGALRRRPADGALRRRRARHARRARASIPTRASGSRWSKARCGSRSKARRRSSPRAARS